MIRDVIMDQIVRNMQWNAKRILEEYGIETEIQWVKAHNEENGNEVADSMAGRGMRAATRDKDYNGYENWKFISKKAIRNEIESKTMKEVKDKYIEWKNTSKYGNIYRMAREKWTKKGRKEMRVFRRVDMKNVIGIRTGHLKLGKYLNSLMKKNITEKCFCEKAEEQMSHLWNECEMMEIQRKRKIAEERITEIREKELQRLNKEHEEKNKESEKWWIKDKFEVTKIETMIFPRAEYSMEYKGEILKELIEYASYFEKVNVAALKRNKK